MMLLLTHAVPTFQRWDHPSLGRLLTPRHYNNLSGMVDAGLAWAADNDAYSGFDEGAYQLMLEAIAGLPRCLFVTAPDVVGDAGATLDHWARWRPVVAGYDLPVALVAQDGLVASDVPWSEVDALFIGGSTLWKCGADAMALVREAARRGIWTHMGRVNSVRRIRTARSWGVDSIDGSSWVRWMDTHLPTALRTLDEPLQPTLLA